MNGTALAVNLSRHGVRRAERGAPIASSHRNHVQLGQNHRPLNRVRDFLARFHAQTNVTVAVPDDDERLESHALTRGGLLLHRHDLHDFIHQVGADEVIDDLVLFDRDGVEVDLLQRFDFALFNNSRIRVKRFGER